MRAKFHSIFLAVIFCALLFSVSARAEAVLGQPAPALIATTLDGKKVDIADFKGKVVIIHFWATWCAPCREEMPALEAVWRQYRSKDVQVLAISGDRPRARGDVVQTMQYFSFPAAMFSDLTKNDFGTPSVVPITYVIDRQGVVQNIMTPDVAPLREGPLGDLVKNLLDKKPDPPKVDVPKTDVPKPDAPKTDAKDDAKSDDKK